MLFGSGFPLVVMRWIGCGDGPLLRLTSGCHGAREATTRLRRERQVCTRNPTLSGVEPLSAVGRSVELMTRQHWEHRLPDGVQMQGRDSDGFRLVVSIPVGDDGLWPMRCPQRPRDHVFKIQVGQEQEPTSVVHCPYCGYRADLWAFAPQQLAVAEAATTAVAEQHVAAEVSEMLRRTFEGRTSHGSSSHSGFGIDISYRSDPPPPRRSLPTFEVDETRRTMECERCQERFAVYGLAIYCPSCGQLAPAQQFGEVLRVQQERLAALGAIPTEHRRVLAESGVLTANYESTIKDGFTALETYLKSRFIADAPAVFLAGKGAVFQRLEEAADMYVDHLAIDVRALVGPEAWHDLLRMAAIRHVLTHNSGVVDAKFLELVPDWPQATGQRLHVSEKDASGFLTILRDLASVLRPH